MLITFVVMASSVMVKVGGVENCNCCFSGYVWFDTGWGLWVLVWCGRVRINVI